jgi:hypothetical protein
MPASADHDVVVDCHTQCFGRVGDLAGHFDVGTRRCGIAAWMVVQQRTRIEILSLSQVGSGFAKATGVWEWCMLSNSCWQNHDQYRSV